MSPGEESLICHRCGYCPTEPDEQICPRDGLHLIDRAEHARSPRDSFLGTTLGGKYPILGIIGSGGMGSVYRSIQPMVERPVAIKVVHPSSSLQTDEARGRFQREAVAIARLDNQSIVRLYDFGAEDDGPLYMVMELVQGLTLNTVFWRGGADCEEAGGHRPRCARGPR